MTRTPLAVVTGPTAGIGRCFATTLAGQGYDLCLISRDRARLEELAAELTRTHGISVEVLALDLSDPSGRGQAAEYVSTHSVDMLVNNAGFGLKSSFWKTPIADERRILDVMVTAVMELCHAALPGMRERGSGTIINVSSIASWITSGTYSAAKSWVTVFSESLNRQSDGSGVNVIAVCPGYVRTEFHDRAAMNMTKVPGWMWLTPQQVVDQALRDAKKNKAISVAGLQYKTLGLFVRTAPRWVIRQMSPR